MKKVFVCLFILSFFRIIDAKIIKVPTDFSLIQAAINSAGYMDTVVVDPGTYYENINFNGKQILLTSRYYESGDNAFILSTIIDGSRPSKPDSASVVLFIHHEDSLSVLQGFTIRMGSGTNWQDEHGAGIYREGGGILVALSSPTIKNNLIINNAVVKSNNVISCGGGGIRVGDGNPKILNNVFAFNKGRYGAGIVLNYTGAIVKNNIICRNLGGEDYGGGGIWINHDGSYPKVIDNNTIYGNSSAVGGGGIYNWFGSSSALRNNIIWKNYGVVNSQIYFRNGSPSVTYCDVEGGWKGSGNINKDPGFIDTVYFYLINSSPCIDAGDSSIIYNDPIDSQNLDNAASPSEGGLRNDIGVYGGSGRISLPYYSFVTGVARNDQSWIVKTPFLEQNYPNPFNPGTKIRYSIPEESSVIIKVYDILGKEISTLVNERKPAGGYYVDFNGSNLPSGVYFYQMQVVPIGRQVGGFISTKKFIIIK